MSCIGNCDILGLRSINCGFGNYFYCCLGGENKEYKCVYVKFWRIWKYFEFGKIKFYIEMFYV